MPPTLILIRHAEAEHNTTENWDLSDPLLTANGQQQCRALQDHLRQHCPLADQVELIVTSPMRRTLQTTLIALGWLVDKGVAVEIDAAWQENSDSPCDTGSDLIPLATEFPTLDFSKVDPTYPSKAPSTRYAFNRTAIHARGQACVQALVERPEKVIAVVSHSAFLRVAITHRRFANADYRIYRFGRMTRTGHQLLEDRSTDINGGGMGRSIKGYQEIEEWDFPPENIEALKN